MPERYRAWRLMISVIIMSVRVLSYTWYGMPHGPEYVRPNARDNQQPNSQNKLLVSGGGTANNTKTMITMQIDKLCL